MSKNAQYNNPPIREWPKGEIPPIFQNEIQALRSYSIIKVLGVCQNP